MVYKGPSRGCEACRKRRVKCDEGRPSCGNCLKRRLECPGYRNLFDAVHKDETKSITVRAHSKDNSLSEPSSPWLLVKSEPDDTYSVNYTLPPDREVEALCFFFSNYVNTPRDSRSNIYLQHILPLYINAAPDSPLKLATSTVSMKIHSLWQRMAGDIPAVRLTYAKAISALRQSLDDPTVASSDEVLCTIFMLDFYDSLKQRYNRDTDRDTHQKGAMTLIQRRNLSTFKSDTSKRLMSALRARYIWFALQSRRPIEIDPKLLSEQTAESLPGAKVDIIMAELANLQFESRMLIEHDSSPSHPSTPDSPVSPDSISETMTFEDVFQRALDLDSRLHTWRQELPPSWTPYRIFDTSTIHTSIHTLGLYNNLCDVYSSLPVSHINNAYRIAHVTTLRLMNHCLRRLDNTSPYRYLITVQEINSQIQSLADDICASVPFHMGSRADLALPHEQHHYPPIPTAMREQASFVDSFGQPTKMTDADHNRDAAASGGWYLLTPLSMMMSVAQTDADANEDDGLRVQLARIKLRKGQLEWIVEQVRRIHRIYVLPPPL